MFIKKEKQPAIWVYEDSFDCSDFISKIEEEASKDWGYLSWFSSTTGEGQSGLVSEYRTSYEMSLNVLLEKKINDELAEISEQFKNIFSDIDKCVWDYRESFDLFLNGSEGMNLLKYGPSGEYHNHYDHAPSNARVLSMVANFGEDYEGGELEFPYFDISIKLQKNSLVLFPSNFPYIHIAHPISKGIKYSLVTWFR
jgi:hypothetical protein